MMDDFASVIPGKPKELWTVWDYSKIYTKKVVIGGLTHNGIPGWVAEALGQMQRLSVIMLAFLRPEAMMCDMAVFEALCNHLSRYMIQVVCPTSHMILGFAKGDSDKAELRSIAAEIVRLTYFKSFAITTKAWETVDTLVCNGILDMGCSKQTYGIRTLKLDCGPQYSVHRGRHVRMAKYLQDLSDWFPNLEHFELNFQDDNGLRHPDERETWLDKMLSFEKLRHLSFKSVPSFIDGTIIEGHIYETDEGSQKSHWHAGCPAMVPGYNRVTTYTARAVRVATNICETFVKKKRGVPLSKMDFIITGEDHYERMKIFELSNAEREEWWYQCVPQITCQWRERKCESGEPLVKVKVAGEITCEDCRIRDTVSPEVLKSMPSLDSRVSISMWDRLYPHDRR